MGDTTQERRPGKSRLKYDKETRTIVAESQPCPSCNTYPPWHRIDCEAHPPPYSETVTGWLYLPKNPVASGPVFASRCYLTEDEPEHYKEMRRTVGCWWANGRYYHSCESEKERGYITHWMPKPEGPREP